MKMSPAFSLTYLKFELNLTYLLNPYEPSLTMAVNYSQLPNAKAHAELAWWDRQKINT